MLHRPPPLMRILRPPSFVRSRSSVSAPLEAAKIAAMVPAAPAPMTTTRFIGDGWISRFESGQAYAIGRIQSLCVGCYLTFAVYEFGVEINPAVPFNCVEGHPDTLKILILPYPLKHPK